jgi:hypothetical protein
MTLIRALNGAHIKFAFVSLSCSKSSSMASSHAGSAAQTLSQRCTLPLELLPPGG